MNDFRLGLSVCGRPLVDQEFEEYANHAITREQLIERLRSRIGLYLSENKE